MYEAKSCYFFDEKENERIFSCTFGTLSHGGDLFFHLLIL